MYKKYYSRFLAANTGLQHYAAHSHHYWPDVTREATLQYWDDSAQFVDDKWGHFYSDKIPSTQKLIADVLKLSAPQQIVFAPNTHEFVFRLLSCFDLSKPLKILTTDSEFHSFNRQINRLAETAAVKVCKVPTLPLADFEDRLIYQIKNEKFDLIFISQVFFNSGFALSRLNEIVAAAPKETMVVIDGYHGFMAVPTDLSGIEDRIFYLAGSYKYAQGGEGCCFLHVPKACQLRPLYTGWFAGFSELTAKSHQVSYSDDGQRFAGSTMDFSALYRLHAVLSLFKKEGLTVEVIHSYIQKNQRRFLNQIQALNSNILKTDQILMTQLESHGHFFAFQLASPEVTKTVYDYLKSHQIITDFRADRLRFGFGLYQEEEINLSALLRYDLKN